MRWKKAGKKESCTPKNEYTFSFHIQSCLSVSLAIENTFLFQYWTAFDGTQRIQLKCYSKSTEFNTK